MKLYTITVCHMEPEIVAWSLMRFRRTTSILPDDWTLLNNQWPLNRKRTSADLAAAASLVNADYLSATNNLGGVGGFNDVLDSLDIYEDNLVLLYDPDSNPLQQGWLEAMIDVMKADLTLGYVSLLDKRKVDHKWTYETIAGHKVSFIPYPEMWNVTLFRGSALDKGLLADSDKWKAPFYGHVETAMFRHVRAKGMRNGYMFDFREGPCPLEHPLTYRQWKVEHAAGRYPGNFDVWCKEKGIE